MNAESAVSRYATGAIFAFVYANERVSVGVGSLAALVTSGRLATSVGVSHTVCVMLAPHAADVATRRVSAGTAVAL